jgi:hypothetical protein
MKLSNFINGSFVAPVNGQYLDNFQPSTGLKYGEIPFASGIARGLHTVEGRNLILFSKRFQEKLQKLDERAFNLKN